MWNGIEIANYTRTLSYINAGLGPSGLSSPGSGCLCTALLFGGSYVSPSADPAPWYDPAKSESTQFLGFVPWRLDLVPSMARTTGPSGIYGSSMGRLALAGNIVQGSGWLVAATQAAQEYGERWLLAALRSQSPAGCAGCDLGVATILPACPDGSSAAFQNLYRCGIVDYTAAQPVDDATPFTYFRQVSFQLRSELPWIFYTPAILVATTTTFPASATTTTGTWPGEAGIKFTINTGTVGNVGPLLIQGVVVSGNGSPYSFTTEVLPPNATLTIDGATRDVALINNATGLQIGGIDYIHLTSPFSWPEMVAQSQMTWSVSVPGGSIKNANTSAKIERIDREV